MKAKKKKKKFPQIKAMRKKKREQSRETGSA